MSLSRIAAAGMAFTLAASLVSQAGPAAITVDLARPAHRVPDTLWGIFFEEINHAGEGGLYGELVQNRDLEAAILPEGWRAEGQNVFTPRGWRADRWFTNDLPGWSLVTEGGAQFSYRFTPNSLTILRLPIPARARAGPERD